MAVADLLEELREALREHYAVESEVGRGGMATVFLAEDLKHGRRVAIKVLSPELSSSIDRGTTVFPSPFGADKCSSTLWLNAANCGNRSARK